MKLADIHLVIFLSRATPLSRWDQMGIFEREVALYRRLAARLGKVSLVTSGGPEEFDYLERLGTVGVLYNRWGLSPNIYSILAPTLHWSALRQATLYRTNQLDGAWTAILAGMLHRKSVIVRAGYWWARFYREQFGDGIKAALIDHLEKFSLKRATKIFLTTEAMKQEIADRYNLSSERIVVIPNYVDTDRLRPASGEPITRRRVCYVGRLHPRKNVDLLIKAMAQIPDSSLLVIGEGNERSHLERLARDNGLETSFPGVLPHKQIPERIHGCDVFVLPSKFEGHPKALLEAMACGLAVVGTDVKGIRNLLEHEDTGLLCPPTVAGIKTAIERLFQDDSLRTRLGNSAGAFVKNHFSLDKIVEIELKAIESVSSQQ